MHVYEILRTVKIIGFRMVIAMAKRQKNVVSAFVFSGYRISILQDGKSFARDEL